MAKNKFETARTLTDKVYDLGYAIENLGCKVAVWVEKFADGMEAEINKQEDAERAARAEAMRRHPAGKGKGFTTDTQGVSVETGVPTRAEKVEFIQKWLGDSGHGTAWRDNPDSIDDRIVDLSYKIATKTIEAKKRTEAGGKDNWSRQYPGFN